MYFIILLVCILLLIPAVRLLSFSIRGLTKTLMIMASYLAKLFAGLVLSGLFFTLPVFNKILSTGWQVILIFLFGVFFVLLMAQLAKRFRLIGYSLNFATDSILFLAITYLLQKRITLSVLVYSVLLLIFPRFSWYLARTDEGIEEQREERRINRFLVEVRKGISFYPIDHWENSRESWRLLPLQIAIASFFYAAGTGTMLFYFQPESRFPAIPIWILITIVNVTFDLFIFRRIDAKLDPPELQGTSGHSDNAQAPVWMNENRCNKSGLETNTGRDAIEHHKSEGNGMSVSRLFDKKKHSDYPYSYHHEDHWVEPEFDYAPENYNKNYPRKYEMNSYVTLEDGVVFTRDVKDYLMRDDIKRVIFTDAPFPEGYKLVDLSLNQDRSILGWNQTIGGDLCLVVSTGEKGRGIEFNRACNMMFASFINLESIEWNNVITTRQTTAMKEMFAGCYKLKNIDLSSLDVSNVKYMGGLFSTCKKLEDIKWFRFNTSKLEDASYMFTNCHSLRSVDLSGFDTSSLKTCEGMFNRCGVKAVNLGNWYPTSQESELKTEGMFSTTGLLSVLTTSNPAVKKEYFNLDDATKECLEENNIPRNIVPVSEWKVPVYDWEKPKSKQQI